MSESIETVKQEFEEDELDEFLELLDEHDIPVTQEDDVFKAHSAATGLLIAHFNTVPDREPAGGWVSYVHLAID